MEYSQIKRLFRRYLSGQVNDDEQRQVELWYDQLEQRPSIPLSAEEEKELEADLWQKLEPKLIKRRKPVRLYAYIGAAAASVALIIFAGILFTSRNKARNAASPQFRDYATGIGERRKLTLQDGSVIALNSAT